MDLQVLISTVNQVDRDFLRKMNLQSDFLVINQIIENIPVPDLKEGIISLRERGLSRSRNLAIKNSSAQICLLCDDDVIYDEGYKQRILDAYSQIPDADIIIFNAVSKGNKKFADFGNRPKKLSRLDLLRVSSVRVSFKRDSIVRSNIKFNEFFGSGSGCFTSGEENIFLTQCHQKKLNIYYYPCNILTLDISESMWFDGFNQKYFFSKGALSKVLFGRLSFLYNLYFILSKYKLYKNTLSPFEALKNMKLGRKCLIEKEYARS